MNVLYFLQERTRYIRCFYATAISPFEEIQHKIRNQEEPYVPSYNEDGYPPFLEEWSESETSVQVIGRTCISLLSNTFKLYLVTWERELGLNDENAQGKSSRLQPEGKQRKKREALLERFKRLLTTHDINVDWDNCPANIGLIEQVALARNRDQHPDMIGTLAIHHNAQTLDKYPQPLFTNPAELIFLVPADKNWPGGYLMDPSLHINSESLDKALLAVEQFAAWIEPVLNRARYRN